MLSVPDMALLGAAALLLFGPDQLPKVMRQVGRFTREIQNTSQSFIREMERAAEVDEPVKTSTDGFPAYDAPTPEDFASPPLEETPVGEKLAEPRSALDVEEPQLPLGDPPPPPPPSPGAEAAPQTDHSTHV